MDFKKISIIFIMCVLCSSCNFFLKPMYEDVIPDYDGRWYLINSSQESILIKSWKENKLFSVLGRNSKKDSIIIFPNDTILLLDIDYNEEVIFLKIATRIDTNLKGNRECDSITFESCDGSKVYHVWRTSLEENGEHPFYQEENWRYESTDNGYTSNWYYTLTPEFLVE